MMMRDPADIYSNASESSESPSDIPEYRMIVRMMELALQDATEKHDSDKRQDARRWLYEDRTDPLSAEWVADMIGLDIETIRWQVRKAPARVHRSLTNAHKGSRRPLGPKEIARRKAQVPAQATA